MKVLLATDGSEFSEGAARFLTRFDFSPDDEIHILYAVNWMPVMSEWESIYVDFEAIRDEIAPRILEPAADLLKPVQAKINASFVEDFPDKAIVDTAVKSGADLIVMGDRGLRGLGSYIVGSVTRLVAINSPKPVLIIKPPQWAAAGKLKILFAAAGSAYSDAMEKTLTSLPFPGDTEVTILNVVFSFLSDIPERFALEINDRIKGIVAETREKEIRRSEEITGKAREYLSRRFSKTEVMIKMGDPSKEILDASEALNADVIALGSSGMRGLRGMLGSVSRYILNHSKCSVLIGKG
ncbi:MAG: universal stress protein [Nitrospirae bacterium]|nr:universal stress protein [Nitrospirota bacterium]